MYTISRTEGSLDQKHYYELLNELPLKRFYCRFGTLLEVLLKNERIMNRFNRTKIYDLLYNSHMY